MARADQLFKQALAAVAGKSHEGTCAAPAGAKLRLTHYEECWRGGEAAAPDPAPRSSASSSSLPRHWASGSTLQQANHRDDRRMGAALRRGAVSRGRDAPGRLPDDGTHRLFHLTAAVAAGNNPPQPRWTCTTWRRRPRGFDAGSRAQYLWTGCYRERASASPAPRHKAPAEPATEGGPVVEGWRLRSSETSSTTRKSGCSRCGHWRRPAPGATSTTRMSPATRSAKTASTGRNRASAPCPPNGEPHNAVAYVHQASVIKDTQDPDPARRAKMIGWSWCRRTTNLRLTRRPTLATVQHWPIARTATC